MAASLHDIATGLVGVLADPDDDVRCSSSSVLSDICIRRPTVGFTAISTYLADNKVATFTKCLSSTALNLNLSANFADYYVGPSCVGT